MPEPKLTETERETIAREIRGLILTNLLTSPYAAEAGKIRVHLWPEITQFVVDRLAVVEAAVGDAMREAQRAHERQMRYMHLNTRRNREQADAERRAEAAERTSAVQAEALAQWCADLKILAYDMHRGWKHVGDGADAAVLIDKFVDEHAIPAPVEGATELDRNSVPQPRRSCGYCAGEGPCCRDAAPPTTDAEEATMNTTPARRGGVNDMLELVLGWSNPETAGGESLRLYALDNGGGPRWDRSLGAGGRTAERALIHASTDGQHREGDRYLLIRLGDRFADTDAIADRIASALVAPADLPVSSAGAGDEEER